MGSAPSDDTRRSLGALGEDLAVRHLERAGLEVVDRNWRSRGGELDIVARDRRAIVFCEVKTRVAGSSRGPAHPLDAIGPRKRLRLRALAREWLAAAPAGGRGPGDIRFDAVGVVVDARGSLISLEHVEEAF